MCVFTSSLNNWKEMLLLLLQLLFIPKIKISGFLQTRVLLLLLLLLFTSEPISNYYYYNPSDSLSIVFLKLHLSLGNYR